MFLEYSFDVLIFFFFSDCFLSTFSSRGCCMLYCLYDPGSPWFYTTCVSNAVAQHLKLASPPGSSMWVWKWWAAERNWQSLWRDNLHLFLWARAKTGHSSTPLHTALRQSHKCTSTLKRIKQNEYFSLTIHMLTTSEAFCSAFL